MPCSRSWCGWRRRCSRATRGTHGTTITPLVDERQLQVVDEHVSAAVAAGAQCLTGGARLALDGSWYPATVLTGCTRTWP